MTDQTIDIIPVGYRKRLMRWKLVTGALIIITLILCVTSLVIGNNNYPLSLVIDVLQGAEIEGATFAIKTLRLPRMLAGLFVGIAFGMAGSAFQTMLRNPLASPDVIGITSGSSVAAVFCILVLHESGHIVSIAAVISGLIVSLLIFLLSKGDHFSGGRLILIGIGIQAMLRSAISYMILEASQTDLPGALRWLNGNLNAIQLSSIPRLAIVVTLFGTLLIFLGRQLKILELGEAYATTLGVNANMTRVLMMVSSVCLIAFGTAVAGPIAFISFLAKPIATRLVGTGFPNELPSGLVGAILVLLADLIGQFAFSTKFPVGVITGMIGAPYLLILLIRMNRKEGIS